eukprot:jgi/Botrbrau1/22791/Bobra.0132s0117.1
MFVPCIYQTRQLCILQLYCGKLWQGQYLGFGFRTFEVYWVRFQTGSAASCPIFLRPVGYRPSSLCAPLASGGCSMGGLKPTAATFANLLGTPDAVHSVLPVCTVKHDYQLVPSQVGVHVVPSILPMCTAKHDHQPGPSHVGVDAVPSVFPTCTARHDHQSGPSHVGVDAVPSVLPMCTAKHDYQRVPSHVGVAR